MEATTIKVSVGKIISSTDRKYGGEGNIETLAQSIEQHGLIHPLAVKESAEKKGYYRVIAGRRRYEAVKSLGWKNVEVTVYADDADEAAIALAENVNREDMHPLDEAETFKRQQDEGKTVEEIAKYYSRSVSGIYHRIRLTNLIDGIKMMFRDGKLKITGAALIASLPHEDQEKFLKKYGEKTPNPWDISGFIHSVQKCTLEHIADKKCEKCKKRTYNTAPGLFEDFNSLEDVCFDGECYAKKWQDFIGGLIAKQAGESGETENNIILDRGIPEFISKKSKTVNIGGQEYNLLASGGHSWKESNKKGKTKTAWLVSRKWNGNGYGINVSRVSYEKSERQANDNNYAHHVENPVKDYMVDQLPNVNEENQKIIAEKVNEKYRGAWRLKSEIKESMLETIINKRLTEENKANLAAIYLTAEFSGEDESGKWCEIDPDYKDIVTAIFGNIGSFSAIPKEPLTQKIFLLIIALSVRTNDMPDLSDDDGEWAEAEKTMFWEFAQMSRDEYTALYKELLDHKIADVLKAPQESEVPGDGAKDPLEEE